MKCDHRNQYFDREICPEPCGRMHYFCDDCGECADECEWDREFTAYEGSSVIDALVSKGWEKISE